MKQNVYDNETFFEGYKNLRESGSGLNDALEQPAIRSMLPILSGLGCILCSHLNDEYEHTQSSFRKYRHRQLALHLDFCNRR